MNTDRNSPRRLAASLLRPVREGLGNIWAAYLRGVARAGNPPVGWF